MAVPTQLSDLSATQRRTPRQAPDTVGTTMDDFLRAHASIIARIAAGTDSLSSPDINGGTIDGAVIGGTTRAAVSGTTGNFNGGLTVTGGNTTTRGISDTATATALTLSGSGANYVTIANSATNPTIGTSAGGLAITPTLILGAGLLVSADGSPISWGDASVQISGNSTADVFAITCASAEQVRVTGTASANRYITLTGSNGGNPTIGTSAGDLQINGSSGKVAQFTSAATPANYVRLQSRATGAAPIIWAEGSDTDVGLEYRTQNAGSHLFITDDSVGPIQVAITHTTSANRYITLTGSNGGNPKIATSGGSLDIGSAVVFTGQTVGTTVGAAGGASALPATPLGYLTTSINGTACKIPYYN